FDARLRAMTGALLVNRSLGGWVESVVTVLTQRFPEDAFAERALRVADFPRVEPELFRAAADFFAGERRV
ncbi:MAG TPA: hypothetical protein VME68_05655, partial [Acidobacteriaceae bacterium]|nr:hypothetical protein [Acidobacteriaceae bacterium]